MKVPENRPAEATTSSNSNVSTENRRPAFRLGWSNYRPGLNNSLSTAIERVMNLFFGRREDGPHFCAVPIPGAQNLPDSVPGSGFVKKPAVYLYPPEDMEVQVTLDPMIKLEIDIPRYHPHHGWRVLAHPDGSLKDLQPELTDLKQYDPNQHGFFYLREIQETGEYPYLYWDGYHPLNETPRMVEGWLVDVEDLSDFFEETLDTLGLLQGEKFEFMDFWLTDLTRDASVASYKLSYLQNEAVQALLPMTVTPTPDTLQRVLLIAVPNPSPEDLEGLAPQTLMPVQRQGFTVFEWGGTVQPSLTQLKAHDAMGQEANLSVGW